MTIVRSGLALFLVGTVVAMVSCDSDRLADPARGGVAEILPASTNEPLAESSAAQARIEALRSRFRFFAATVPGGRPSRPSDVRTRSLLDAIGAGKVARFEGAGSRAETHVRAVVTADAVRGIARRATVLLPRRAADAVQLQDDGSAIAVIFALDGMRDSKLEVAQGLGLYSRGYRGIADVVHRVHAEGTEDFVVFEERPARAELSYTVDVSRVAGLRLVSNTLEFLDEGGSPRLRVAPPYVVDATGKHHGAKLAVNGCVYDTSPAGPWGRTVTKPGAERCTVLVAWPGDVAYPAIVDPAWTATGSMTALRRSPTASVLASGKVLVVGGAGADYVALASAELYDSASATFGATGPMGDARNGHSATVLATGKVLVAGGTSGLTAELYNPGSGTFTPTGSMSVTRTGHTATLLATTSVLVLGGSGDATAELYDAALGTFTQTGPTSVARTDHTASALHSGKVLVAGGYSGIIPIASDFHASTERYDPSTGVFTPDGSMGHQRAGHTASVLPSGKVLIVGGSYMILGPHAHGALALAELYDPATGVFSATGSMTAERAVHTASMLGSGAVLVAGGTGSVNAAGQGPFATGTTELYDVSSGTFADAASMTSPRGGHSASVLVLGNVLVVGGAPDSSAELLFAPSGGSCVTGDDCGSGVCQDGICCAAACSGTCKTCSKGTGACVTVTGSDDPDTCSGATTCDDTGACKLKNGQACPDGAAACGSGFCADGFCCNTACGAGCDFCNVPGHQGTCRVAVARDPGAMPSCSPYVCDGKSTSCPNSCTQDSDCAIGDICNLTTRACGAGGTCDGEHTTTGANGTKQDCSPYKCATSGACKPACESVDDCVAPNACDTSGRCSAPSPDSPGGCHASPRSPSSVAPFALAGLAAAIARLRRARRQPTS